MKTMLQCLVFSATIVLTWIACSTIKARMTGPAPAQEQTLWTEGRANPPQAGMVTSRPVGTSISLSKFAVASEVDIITIAATARIADRKGLSHVWRLQVTGKNNKNLSDSIYRDQVFQVEQGKVSQPTFHEIIPNVVDATQVVLSLYSFQQDQEQPTFLTEADSDRFLTVRRRQNLVELR